ncbi:MAG TPA: RidA family protein [Gemmatimonadales bacterium]|jgi:enamine deaminase RidA (YjgF/YER057c/UK114 family)
MAIGRRCAAVAMAVVLAGACAPVMGSGGTGAEGGPSGRRGMFPGGGGTDTRYINPGTLAALDGFTHAVRVGQTVYVSGEVALDSLGHLVGPGDLAAQARQAFANLAMVLRIAGVAPEDVVRLDVYVVGYKPSDMAVIREAGAQFFPQRNPPAGIVLGVAALPRDGLLIAVDATAIMRAMFRPLREDRGPYN